MIGLSLNVFIILYNVKWGIYKHADAMILTSSNRTQSKAFPKTYNSMQWKTTLDFFPGIHDRCCKNYLCSTNRMLVIK